MNDISKLPKWAQEHVRKLGVERDTAVKALNRHLDQQTLSPFFHWDLVCTGEERGPSRKVFYVDAHTMSILHNGVEVTIYLRDSINITYNPVDHSGFVGVVPKSYGSLDLVAGKEKA